MMMSVLIGNKAVIPTLGGNMHNLTGISIPYSSSRWHKNYYSAIAYIDFAYFPIQYLYI